MIAIEFHETRTSNKERLIQKEERPLNSELKIKTFYIKNLTEIQNMSYIS